MVLRARKEAREIVKASHQFVRRGCVLGQSRDWPSTHPRRTNWWEALTISLASFRALRTIWRSFLLGDALSKRAKKTQPLSMAQLSTESAEEPELCVMLQSRKISKPGQDCHEPLLASIIPQLA